MRAKLAGMFLLGAVIGASVATLYLQSRTISVEHSSIQSVCNLMARREVIDQMLLDEARNMPRDAESYELQSVARTLKCRNALEGKFEPE